MPKKGKKYPIYAKDIEKLAAECEYLILYSNRNTGKSYSTKEFLLGKAYGAGEEFIYLRRGKQETKDIDVIDYFADMDVSKITKGEYQYVNVYRKRIYFATMDEEGKLTNKKKIGYVMDLYSMETKKSLMYPKVGTIVFEEYVTDRYYLPRESDLLQNLVSSVFRDRKGLVLMIGNKISKFNPYVQDWDLHGMMKQKTGTIDTYEIPDGSGKVVRIKCWNIPPMEETSGMFFGNSAKNIDGDSYKVSNQNKLDDALENFDINYDVVLDVQGLMYLMRFLSHKKDRNRFTWYVVPKTTPIRKGSRVVTDRFSSDIMTTRGFIPITEGERRIFDFIKKDKICYVSNMVGTEFKQALKFIDTEL